MSASRATLLTEFVHRPPERANEQVDHLDASYEEHGDELLHQLVSRVVADGELTITAVRAELASFVHCHA